MHWGIRRYQNYDGTLTPAGIERYRSHSEKQKFTDMVKRSHDKREEFKLLKTPQMKTLIKKITNSMLAERKAAHEYSKEQTEFYKNKSLYDKYKMKAIDKMISQYPQWLNGTTKEELFKNFEQYDDVFQDDLNPFKIFVESKSEPNNVHAKEAYSNYYKALRCLKNDTKKYVSLFLDERGNMPISDLDYDKKFDTSNSNYIYTYRAYVTSLANIYASGNVEWHRRYNYFLRGKI